MKKRQFQKIFQQKYLKNSRYFSTSTKKGVVNATVIYSNYFFNTSFDKGKLKSFVSWFLKNYGQKQTIDLLEDLKNLGFGYATMGGISLGLDDLKIPPNKADLLFQADLEIKSSNFRSKRAEITGVEEFQNLIDTWHQTSETLKQEVIKYFELTDIFNPVYMMAFSGARGNVSQVRQLVGMRGLMADPQGQIIDFPIRSNFREGLTLTEYIISTYGARKGIVDTALRTATAGYLTRRLVDVAQHVIVSQFDCGTRRGIFLFDMKEGLKTIYSFKDRLVGRVLAQDIDDKVNLHSHGSTKLAFRNQEISNDLASVISKITKKALVRSPLTCETRRLVCQLCYGWSLSKGSLVSLGEAVGVIAAQSIGEPGTQLTMRTFHTGGVFSGGITDQIIAPEMGSVYYSNPIPGTCIRTPQGEIAFLTKVEGSFLFKTKFSPKFQTIEQLYKVPAYTILFVRHEQKVHKKQILAQFSALSKQQAIQADAEQVIYSKFEGQIYFSHLDLVEQAHEKYGDITWKTDDWAKVWILSGKVYENPILSYFFPQQGDLITKKTLLNQVEWYTPQSSFLEIDSLKVQQESFQKSVRSYSLKNIISKSPKSDFHGNDNLLQKLFLPNLKPLKDSSLTSKTYKSIGFNVFSSSNVYILSKRLMRANFQQFDLLVNPESFRKGELISLTNEKNENYNLNFKNYKINLSQFKIKYARLKTQFYYPFQEISFKRLISFLSYGSQKEVIFSKNLLKFKQFFSHSKFKKTIRKNKLSLPELQKKWHSWIKSHHIPKKIRKKTIQSKLQTKQSLYFSKPSILKRRSRRLYQLNFIEDLTKNTKLRTSSILAPDKIKVQRSISEKQLKLFSNSKNKPFFKQLKAKSKIAKFQDPLHLQNHIKTKTLEPKFGNVEKRHKLIDILEVKKSSETSNFQIQKNSTILLKTPLLEFSLNRLNYKKLSYCLSITQRTNNSLLGSVKSLKFTSNNKKQVTSDFMLTNKIQFLTFFPLTQNFLTNDFKVKNLALKSSFSTNFLLKNKAFKERNLELKNTFSWSNYPTKFLSWFPDEYQTINNGIFLFSRLLGFNPYSSPNSSKLLVFLQKTRKSLKTFQNHQIFPLKSLLLLNISPLPESRELRELDCNLRIFKDFEKRVFDYSSEKKFKKTKFGFRTINDSIEFNNIKDNEKAEYQTFKFQLLKHLNQNSMFLKVEKSNSPFKMKKSTKGKRTIFNFLNYSIESKAKNTNLLQIKDSPLKISSYLSKNSTINFFKVKAHNSTVRWNNKKFIENLEQQKSKNYTFSKILKFKVNFDELFWIPEETYEISIQGIEKDRKIFNTNLVRVDQNINNINPILKKNDIKEQIQNSYFIESQKPLFLILNRQGLKKTILSNLEGFISINTRPDKNKKASKILLNKDSFYNSSFNKLKTQNSFLTKQPNFSKLQLDQKMFNRSGLLKLEILKTQLKNNLNCAILKCRKNTLKRMKIQHIFKKKFIKTSEPKNISLFSKNVNSLGFFNNFENEEKIGLGFFPLQKSFISQSCTTKKTSKKSENSSLLNRNSSDLKVVKKQITIKQGWVVISNDFSKINYLHHSIVEPGVMFLNNLLFHHYRIFIEILPSQFNSNLTTQTRLELDQGFKLTKKILNQNGRFVKQAYFDSMEAKPLILIRPMHYKIIKNSECFKRKIHKFNKKTSFSLLNLKNFSSSLVNQQQSTLKIMSSFPGPDVILGTKLNLPPNNSTKIKTTEKILKSTKQFTSFPVFYDYFLKHKVIPLNQKIANNIEHKYLNFTRLTNQYPPRNQASVLRSICEQSYYSLQPINLNPIFVQGSIPPSQSYLFKVPLVKFNISKTGNFQFLPFKTFKTQQLLNFLNFKSFYTNRVKENGKNSGKLSNFDNSIKHQKQFLGYEISKNREKTKSNICQLFQFHSLTVDFFPPVFQLAYSEKMNYLYNQRFFDYEGPEHNLVQTNLNQNSYLRNVKSKTVTHFIPKIQNKYFVYPTNQVLTNQAIGKTGFISPFNGEIITKPFSIYSLKTNDSSLNGPKRLKEQLILTKSDITSIVVFNSKAEKEDHKLNQEYTDIQNSMLAKKVVSSKDYLNISEKNLKFYPSLKQKSLIKLYLKILTLNSSFQLIDNQFEKLKKLEQFELKNFNLKYLKKIYKINGLKIGQPKKYKELRLGKFLISGDLVYSNFGISKSGQIIHLNRTELTIRRGDYLSVSPNAILHSYNGEFIKKNTALMTLPFQTLKTGDIVQGIPKVEQYLEARTTQQGRLFVRSLPVLMQAIFERYCQIMPHDKAVRQSLLKIQQILVDGVQRVYRSQGISIADKHLEIIVKQMTSKVQIIFGGQTGLFPGELVDLDFVERLNRRVLIKIYYEPIVLGITRASLEVDSFLSAASFQQTTKILAKAAIYKQKDYLKGLKENLLIGNLIPAGTGYITVSKF